MNKQKLFILALVTVLTFGLGSCRTQRVNAEPTSNNAGAQTTRTYAVGPFSKIVLSGVSSIYFTQGSKRSVEAKGTADELARVKIYVDGGCLYVKSNDTENNRRDQHQEACRIYVTAPKLSDLKVSGVGSFTAKALESSHFNLHLSGVGNFNVEQLKSDDTHINISGVGSAKTSVEGDNLYVHTSGVSNSNIKFKGKVADIQNSGVGSTTVDVECDEVWAKNSGQSTLKLKGHADKTHVDNSGMASIDTQSLNQY